MAQNPLRQVFIKVLGTAGKTFTVDIEVAKSREKLKKHLKELLPPNAVLEIRKNGYVLRDHQEVR